MKKRYQRIINILAAAPAPMSLGAVNRAVDAISESTHTETLIGMDLRTLIGQDLVAERKDHTFTLTALGEREVTLQGAAAENRAASSPEQRASM